MLTFLDRARNKDHLSQMIAFLLRLKLDPSDEELAVKEPAMTNSAF